MSDDNPYYRPDMILDPEFSVILPARGTVLTETREGDSLIVKYEKLKNDKQRAYFAIQFVWQSGAKFSDEWAILYDMLRNIRDNEAYKNPVYMKEYGGPVDTFDEFFAKFAKKPFAKFVELESAYKFAVAHCPGFRELSYKEVVARETEFNRKERAQKKAETVRAIAAANPEATQQRVADLFEEETGEAIDQASVSRSMHEQPNIGDSCISTINQQAAKQGVSDEQIRKQRKLLKAAPDFYDAWRRGEYKSLNAACVAAGLAKKPTPYEIVLANLPKLNRQECLQMIEVLQARC